MNINFLVILILLLTEYLSFINTINLSSNHTLTMFILTTTQSSSPSLIKHYLKRRSLVHVIYATSNITNDSIKNSTDLSTNKIRTFDNSQMYNIIKDGSSEYRKVKNKYWYLLFVCFRFNKNTNKSYYYCCDYY